MDMAVARRAQNRWHRSNTRGEFSRSLAKKDPTNPQLYQRFAATLMKLANGQIEAGQFSTRRAPTCRRRWLLVAELNRRFPNDQAVAKELADTHRALAELSTSSTRGRPV